ncbi:MAG: NAD-dependent epimerase/dehydratase family protein [Ardenticatenaceae bacterium]|nr:NAD-dependent epimerase/dehydratase family protein [Ardenticatenaceae bacterium]MCB9446170.1 NAD-dependent epimerase/dehydratase family protein [Ardenticatenaceae bacterium]
MNEQTSLVTGGSGFLGQALVAALRRRGIPVISFDLAPHPDTAVPSIVGDLRNPADVTQACQGVNTVFHTASHVGWTLAENQLVHAVNVTGTQNLLQACQMTDVRQFIYTSSIDAVFEGRPIRQGDESLPYARRPLNAYSATKAAAEQMVLAANNPDGLLTCALRTAGIFGPGDKHRLPNIIGNARQGRAIRLGNGRARFNHVYIDNVVHAHLLAAEALTADSPTAGQAYFITDDAPTNFYDFMEPFLQGLGYDIPIQSIPYGLAYALAIVLETLQRLHVPLPPTLLSLTRYTVASTCIDFHFTHAKASRDFGYQPLVSRPEAIAATLNWLRQTGYEKQ